MLLKLKNQIISKEIKNNNNVKEKMNKLNINNKFNDDEIQKQSKTLIFFISNLKYLFYNDRFGEYLSYKK